MALRLNAEGEEKQKSDKVLDATGTQKQLDKAYNLNLVTDTANMAKNSVDGILYGAVAGLVTAYFLKQKLYYGAGIGALVGGVLGYASHASSCD